MLNQVILCDNVASMPFQLALPAIAILEFDQNCWSKLVIRYVCKSTLSEDQATYSGNSSYFVFEYISSWGLSFLRIYFPLGILNHDWRYYFSSSPICIGLCSEICLLVPSFCIISVAVLIPLIYSVSRESNLWAVLLRGGSAILAPLLTSDCISVTDIACP